MGFERSATQCVNVMTAHNTMKAQKNEVGLYISPNHCWEVNRLCCSHC